MLKKRFLDGRIFVIAVLSIVFLAQSGEVFAEHRGSKSRHKPHFQSKAFTIPHGYVSIVLGGFKFYYRDRARRRFWPHSYAFVPAPVVCVPERIIIAQAPTVKETSEETVVVNIPNFNGSHTSITLRKSGNGYIGPQGEYYPDNPTVEQLKALYGK